MGGEKEAAEQLTKFLLDRPAYGSGKSPLQEYVETEIKAIAKKIAAEVVAENPSVAETIRGKTSHIIAKALADDSFLNSTVTQAVAKALTTRALGEDD
jgi:hypothetical protein